MLSAVYPGTLHWEWNLPDPYQWKIWLSWDGGNTWVFNSEYWTAGAGRSFVPDGGSELYYVVGVYANGNEVTEHSNQVRPDDAQAPEVPQTIQGLQLWVRVESLAGLADGAAVDVWPDEGGRSINLVQATAANRPTYRANAIGQPSVQFDGLNDLLASSAVVFNTDRHTIFIVAQPYAVSECDMLGTGGTGNGDVLMMIYGSRFRGHAWRGSYANAHDGASNIQPGTVGLFEQVVSDADMTLRLNGSQDALGSMYGTKPSLNKPVTLGSRSAGSWFNGHIMAVLVYDRALSVAEVDTVRQYLFETYFTNYSLPTQYPLSLQSNLMAYWKLDEPEGDYRYDSGNNYWDLQEWSFQEAQGGDYIPVGQGAGVLGDAADFGDGSGGKGLVGYYPNTLLDGDFTFSLWVNFNNDYGFDGQGVISLGGTMGIGIRAYTGATDFVIYNASTNQHSYLCSPDSLIVTYEWDHAVYVKEGNTMRIYVNGQLVATGAYSGSYDGLNVNYFSDTDLIMGINPWGYPLIGMLDEVGCWSRALSASEVEQLYNYGDGLAYEGF